MYQEEIPFLRRRRNFFRGGLSQGRFTVKSRSDLAVPCWLYSTYYTLLLHVINIILNTRGWVDQFSCGRVHVTLTEQIVLLNVCSACGQDGIVHVLAQEGEASHALPARLCMRPRGGRASCSLHMDDTRKEKNKRRKRRKRREEDRQETGERR